MADDGKRLIPPGSCTWCGHRPHDDTCRQTLRTKDAENAPCPCRKHLR